jgi:hypothetical protein
VIAGQVLVDLTGVGCAMQSELGLAAGGPIGGRRLSEAVSLNLGADYVSELGSGGAWADQRLTKSEIAADPEAAALATYFRQVRTESSSWRRGCCTQLQPTHPTQVQIIKQS